MQKNVVRKSRVRQHSNNTHVSLTHSTFLLFVGFALGGVCIAFLKNLLHRPKLIIQQPLQSEKVIHQQSQLMIEARDPPSNEETQSEARENPLHDLAASSAAHTAQLTLISILLGVVIQALLSGLPTSFFFTLWPRRDVDLDFRVLATFLAAIDLWIKYSWGVIVVRWPFLLSHSLIYALVSGFMIGEAMSVNRLNDWIGWGTVFCFATSLAYMQNMQSAFSEKKHRKLHSHRPIASEDPPYSAKELARLRKSSIGNALLILVPGSIGLYSTLNSHHWLPLWLQWRLSFPPGLWGECVTFFVLLDLFIAGWMIMPKERYGHTTSSNTVYYYSDIIDN